MKMRVVLILAALVGLVVAKPSKPEAEAEPFADADDDAELEAATAYDYSNPDFASYGYRVGKRSAEPFYGYGDSGLATWPSASYGYGSSSTVYGARGYRVGK